MKIQLVTFLESLKPDAPMHPIFVHFSIALTAISFFFDLLSYCFHFSSLTDAGWWTLACSALLTVFTLISGVISRMRLPMEESKALSFMRLHMALGPTFFGMLLIATFWRASHWEAHLTVSASYLFYGVCLLAVMLIQGYLGGELVYRYGAEVKGSYQKLPVALDQE